MIVIKEMFVVSRFFKIFPLEMYSQRCLLEKVTFKNYFWSLSVYHNSSCKIKWIALKYIILSLFFFT